VILKYILIIGYFYNDNITNLEITKSSENMYPLKNIPCYPDQELEGYNLVNLKKTIPWYSLSRNLCWVDFRSIESF